MAQSGYVVQITKSRNNVLDQLEKREFPQKRNFFYQLLTRWH